VRVVVLGSAAGGGIPEWRCACPNCQAGRHRGGEAKPRSQDSIAVSADGQRWVLLNVSPDITRQVESTSALWPAAPEALGASGPSPRVSPIIGAVLTNGDLDHSIGLLALREAAPLCLYATRETYAGLVVQNAVFRTLNGQRPHVLFRQLELDVFVPLRDIEGKSAGLSLSAFPVQGKVPLHMESFIEASDETNIGVIVRDDETGARLVYVPGAGSAEGIAERARDATCLFFDGTFWSDAEVSRFGQSPRPAREVAHLPVGGPRGSLALLEPLPVARRYYTHVNGTNPMLRAGSTAWSSSCEPPRRADI
jgi:pyrroloquinoline quinone biosynthesis protein B